MGSTTCLNPKLRALTTWGSRSLSCGEEADAADHGRTGKEERHEDESTDGNEHRRFQVMS